jgi:hypothetical protein
MTSSEDRQHQEQQLAGLSSACDDLSTSTGRRSEELLELAELLQSIKQLQDQADHQVRGLPLLCMQHRNAFAHTNQPNAFKPGGWRGGSAARARRWQ